MSLCCRLIVNWQTNEHHIISQPWLSPHIRCLSGKEHTFPNPSIYFPFPERGNYIPSMDGNRETRRASAVNYRCQICLEFGHWSFHCKSIGKPSTKKRKLNSGKILYFIPPPKDPPTHIHNAILNSPFFQISSAAQQYFSSRRTPWAKGHLSIYHLWYSRLYLAFWPTRTCSVLHWLIKVSEWE